MAGVLKQQEEPKYAKASEEEVLAVRTEKVADALTASFYKSVGKPLGNSEDEFRQLFTSPRRLTPEDFERAIGKVKDKIRLPSSGEPLEVPQEYYATTAEAISKVSMGRLPAHQFDLIASGLDEKKIRQFVQGIRQVNSDLTKELKKYGLGVDVVIGKDAAKGEAFASFIFYQR